MDSSAEQDTGSQLPGIVSPQKELATIVAIVGGYSSLVSYSVSSIKRGSPEPMDTEEVDTASTPKKHKVEPEQQLVQAKNGQAKKYNFVKVQQQEEPEGAKLQI